MTRKKDWSKHIAVLPETKRKLEELQGIYGQLEKKKVSFDWIINKLIKNLNNARASKL